MISVLVVAYRTPELLRRAKRHGLSDRQIDEHLGAAQRAAEFALVVQRAQRRLLP